MVNKFSDRKELSSWFFFLLFSKIKKKGQKEGKLEKNAEGAKPTLHFMKGNLNFTLPLLSNKMLQVFGYQRFVKKLSKLLR